MKGIRKISGREYFLCGRYSSRGRADYVADALLREWEQARVRRTPHRFGDWSVWVSGRIVKEVCDYCAVRGCEKDHSEVTA